MTKKDIYTWYEACFKCKTETTMTRYDPHFRKYLCYECDIEAVKKELERLEEL